MLVQVDGVKFALKRGGRVLLADEMGLGKTIQVRNPAICAFERVTVPCVLSSAWYLTL
jgi:hypothetical protein